MRYLSEIFKPYRTMKCGCSFEIKAIDQLFQELSAFMHLLISRRIKEEMNKNEILFHLLIID